MTRMLQEVQCDGLVGPTHNYAGLSYGNVASASHGGQASNPKRAALEGLAKMRLSVSLGQRQLVIPPHPRPNLEYLHALGFRGSMKAMLESAARTAPVALAQAYSAAAMWTANLATVSPAADSAHRRLQLSVANLGATAHRAQEAAHGERVLNAMLGDVADIHAALPVSLALTDEGAANHMRLASSAEEPGVEIFVYGRIAGQAGSASPARFPARQTREASEAVARRHGLDPSRTIFVQQQSVAIDAGVFHNDVIAMSHGPLLVHHEFAFEREDAFYAGLRTAYGDGLQCVRIADSELLLGAAVKSYFFNSQLLGMADGTITIVAPSECAGLSAARGALERLRDANDNTVGRIEYLDVRESMRNGGGPACLRLRLPLTEGEWDRTNPAFRYDAELHEKLAVWIETHYRDRVVPDDLRDAEFAEECLQAWEALQKILPV